MNNSYEINKSRVQQLGLTTTVKDDGGKEHYFYRGHEYIEIGGIKWAVTNIGAEKETDGGLYFAFGETKGYTAEQVRSGKRKFKEKEYTNVEFDSVNAYWGGKWRMPTADEFESLLKATTNRWVYNYQGSGVNGNLFIDKTDSSKVLFFPALGVCFHGGMEHVDYYGYYWSSSLFAHNSTCGIYLLFDRWSTTITYNISCLGLSIRGVVGD